MNHAHTTESPTTHVVPARPGAFARYAPIVAGILLGLLFIMSAVVVLFKLVPTPPMPEGTPMAMFMGAFGPTGYMTFIKVLELIGGILVAIPRTRNLGLLILGPILVNILAFHLFITKGEGLLDPMLLFIVALALYLLWVERKAFAGLVNSSRTLS
jgi:nicotinamide riboside transporter PnuC